MGSKSIFLHILRCLSHRLQFIHYKLGAIPNALWLKCIAWPVKKLFDKMRSPITLLTDHPSSVGESYFGHLRTATGFGLRMLGGGLACLLHGIFPFLFEKTGSSQIRLLHDRMVTHRNKLPQPQASEAEAVAAK